MKAEKRRVRLHVKEGRNERGHKRKKRVMRSPRGAEERIHLHRERERGTRHKKTEEVFVTLRMRCIAKMDPVICFSCREGRGSPCPVSVCE